MSSAPDVDHIADAVIKAHQLIQDHGTSEMKALSRMLLLIVGQEIARHSCTRDGVTTLEMADIDRQPKKLHD
ncbi:hypothetical protein MKK63_09115 [Methylobacterium sp. J-088]|uniref:hypothetical protein n=1 Tax=Methylobacterium sp. J-088 TaxID=2836664 RepID=UPI001FB8C3E3|nr:hypothetical protein [Methylobacterium sp. J-088]MCJ2062867.1 hypothetical protein [Methylobacterium sp. J-088]